MKVSRGEGKKERTGWLGTRVGVSGDTALTWLWEMAGSGHGQSCPRSDPAGGQGGVTDGSTDC